MKLRLALTGCAAIAALALADVRDASACGGCFVPPDENTQVTGHRMLLSISQSETTLWDQISYSGDPASFAWVLPTRGQVEIGLSSDALFAFIGNLTHPQVSPPPLNCPGPPDGCYGPTDAEGDLATGTSASGAGGGSGGGVNVIAQEVVGPYETVQLSASDPTALATWLAQHGYNIPADVQPVIDAYVTEGFDFLALKLVPGAGVDAMKPVRVTAPGAAPSLPLRMVAAGTGATTPITLWVVGEGRYETTNFPSFTIDPDAIVWNWDDSSDNYNALLDAGFKSNSGLGWATEAAQPMSTFDLDPLLQVATVQPDLSGYGDATGMGAYDECLADLQKVYGTVDQSAMWLTRMHAELPHAALSTDLQIGASMSQDQVPHFYQATKTTGTTPSCPVYNCDGQTTGGDATWPWGPWSRNDGGVGQSGSCAMGTKPSGDVLALVGLAAAGMVVRRRRRQKR